MSKHTGSKAAAPAGKGHPLLVGLLLGLIVGVGLAAGLAWYLMKSPSPFVTKDALVSNKQEAAEQTKAAAVAVVQKHAPAVSAVAASSAVGDDKPRFEFYKVLTDKTDATSVSPATAGKTAAAPKVAAETVKAEAAKPVVSQIYYLQAGAFANEAEAEKLKASLIFEGMEVAVLTVSSADKGVLHKVRVGPYQGADEMNRARAKLQQKGIASTPMHG